MPDPNINISAVTAPSFVEVEMDALHDQLKRESEKGVTADQEHMLRIALQIVLLSRHLDSRDYEKLIKKWEETLKECMHNMRGTINTRSVICLTMITSLISVGAAGCAFAPFLSGVLPQDAIKVLAEKGTVGLQTLAQGSQAVHGLAKDSGQREQLSHQHVQEIYKKKVEDASGHKQGSMSHRDTTHRSIDEVNSASHQAKRSVASRN